MKLNIGKTPDGKAFKLPLDLVTQTQAIIATKGKGKTYLAMVQAEEMLAAGQQIICLDPTGVWWGLQADGVGKGFPIVVMGGDHGNVPLEPNSGEIIADFLVESNQSAVLDLSAFESNAAQSRFVTAFAERFYRRKASSRTPVHLMLDEADSFAPQRPMPGEQRMLGAFEAIVRRGRSRGIGITLITQRPAVLNKNVLMMAELLTCLGIVGHIDQDAVDEWVKRFGTGEQRKAFMATLASIPKGTAWFWSPAWLDCFTQVIVREKRTFDSSKTPEAGAVAGRPASMATPNLELLTAQIKATIEKARADNPIELKRRVAELEKKLKQAESATKPCGHQEELARLRADNRLQANVIKSLQVFKKSVDRRIIAIQQDLGDLQKSINDLLAGHFIEEAARIRNRLDRQNTSNPQPKSGQIPKDVNRIEQVQPPQGDASVSRTQQKILDAIAALERFGVSPASKVQVALMAGYSHSSGGYANLLGSLRSAGLIEYPAAGAVALTQAGSKIAEPDNCLASGSSLLDAWYSKIGQSQAKLLRELVDHFPRDMAKAELAERVNESATSGGFANKLGRMRTLGLITYPGPGRVKASDLLFVEK